MKTTNVKQSKKNSGWFLAIPHKDEKGFEALAYLRKNGYFNTPLYRLNRNASQKQIVRYYLRYPQRENRRVIRPTFTEEERLEYLDWETRHEMKMLETKNRRLEKTIAQLEAENAKLRTEAMEEEGLYDNEDVEQILKSPKYGSWVKTANADEYPKLHTPNLNFVTPDMSATLGRGTHVLIDIDKVPKDLQVLLAKMMDALNDHTLRISRLENC